MSIPSKRFHEIIKKYVQYTLMNDLFRIYFFKRLLYLQALVNGLIQATTMKIMTTTIIIVQSIPLF